MINGFVLDITNENKEAISISLFTGSEIPKGVTISIKNSNDDYNALLSMSMNEGFIGGGISTDDERISQVNIFKNGSPSSYEFHKIIDNLEIIIDGISNYITIVIPPTSKSLFQLMPFLK